VLLVVPREAGVTGEWYWGPCDGGGQSEEKCLVWREGQK